MARHLAQCFTERGYTVSSRVIDSKGIKLKGIPYCPDHIRRLYEADRFPKPFKLPGSSRKLWFEDEVDAYLVEIAAAQRPQTAAAE
jgi:hypothetical protein